MRLKYIVILFLVLAAASAGIFYFRGQPGIPAIVATPNLSPDSALSIAAMRSVSYPGSDLTIEQTLAPDVNSRQYIASYLSEDLKIYGLLTVPEGTKPPGGWPVIIFNHGYIPPDQYRTTERYVAYVDAFARNGYIVFKSDYRGHGSSEGKPESAYYSPAYAIDILNALASVKRYNEADPARIGMWGHSLGGNITLRDIIVNTKNIKAAVIWGGVVGSYYDLANNWQHRVAYRPPAPELANRNSGRQQFISMYGAPATSSAFWNSIDPTAHLADITASVQLHTGGSDGEVPVVFSQNLYASLTKLGKIVEYYNYPGGDHNISSPDFELAMQRSIDFFNKYLK